MASTSRVSALLSVVRPRSFLRALPGPSFSTSSAAFSRREVAVELLEDVSGLGRLHDRILVTPGRARNDLIPSQRARYIPWKRKSDIQLLRTDTALDSSRTSPSPTSSDTGIRHDTPAELLESLQSIPSTLTFPLRTTSEDSSALHGSLTLLDISSLLSTKFGITGTEWTVSWLDESVEDRMKELGKRDVVVRLTDGGQEQRVIQVEAVRLE